MYVVKSVFNHYLMNQHTNQIPSFQQAVKQVNNAIDDLPSETKGSIVGEAERLKSNHSSDVLKLQLGDQAPDFTLKNAVGKSVTLYDLLKDNRVVLTFYRGTWCPYCNLQLTQYQEVIFKLKSIGSTMVAVSPQTPDESLNMQEKNALSFEVLSDPQNKITSKFTTIIQKSSEFTQTISGFGKSFEDHYSDDSHEVPIPAVFIIEQDGSILFAKSEGGDYRNRVEVKDVIDVLSRSSK